MSKVQVSSRTAPKNISVYLRIRPPVPLEKGHTCENIKADVADKQLVHVTRKSGTKDTFKDYRFSQVFRDTVTQKEVYNTFAKNAVNASFDGQHGVLFVYGQTGSGKTYTISNEDPERPGVLQQAMSDIWDRIAADKDNDYSCSVSYVQLYNEILTDLLDDRRGIVRIQIGSEGRGDVDLVSQNTGLPIEKPVTDYKSTMDFFHIGMSRKEMQSTSMNLTSSRSHTVFTFNIKKSCKTRAVTVDGSSTETGGGALVSLEGRLVLCDLAGSERVSKTHAEGKTLDEAMHINSSLLVLGKVVAALTEHSQHAPFRESKLTRILQYSLLGNGNTSIMVNISPSDNNTEESISAILFGQRAIQIKQDAKRHEVLDYKALYLQLMAELDAKNDDTLKNALEDEKTAYEDQIAALQDQIHTLTLENDALKGENARLRANLPADQVSLLTGAAEAAASGLAGGGAGSWLIVVSKLRDMLIQRDVKMKEMGEERIRLGMQLAEEVRKSFNLAKKLQSLGWRYKMERTFYMKRLDELNVELAGLKGTDYLNATMSMSAGKSGPAGADSGTFDFSSPRSPLPPQDGGNGEEGSVALEEELSKAMATIRALREERIELIIYRDKAVRAIRMLAGEKKTLAST